MTNTFKAAGTAGWQVAVDGANYARVGIQTNSSQPVHVCIASDLPAEDHEDYMILATDLTREIVVTILSTDKIYIRSSDAVDPAVRGFREAR